MYTTKKDEERAVLVSINDDKTSLDELAELVRTAGGMEVGRMSQLRDAPHNKHYIGKGKLDELKDLVELTDATAIVCDDELKSSQQRTLAEFLDVKILDRTMIILDIFAARASTAEGKLQVELAQLSYSIAHLSGLGTQLSRLGGGIGTRGPGEKKLETDRRHIRTRMEYLRHEVDKALSHRKVARKARTRNNIPTIAIVGYTNAGKSTLINALCDANVPAQDKLFMTLDTTSRAFKLPSGQQVILSDTVGFINKLPHKLIDAFRATLEELEHADILLHVMDASSPQLSRQVDVVNKTLRELGLSSKPTITAINKIDAEQYPTVASPATSRNVYISALNGTGLDILTNTIEELVNENNQRMNVYLPYSEGALMALINRDARVISQEDGENGITYQLFAGGKLQNQLKEFKLD